MGIIINITAIKERTRHLLKINRTNFRAHEENEAIDLMECFGTRGGIQVSNLLPRIFLWKVPSSIEAS